MSSGAFVGMVPVPAYDDGTGAIFINPDQAQIGALDDGGGPPRRLLRRLARVQQAENRLENRLGQFAGQGSPAQMAPPATMADAYAALSAQGLINENQVNGLGYASVTTLSTGTLTDTLNRTVWVKSINVEASATASQLLVTSIDFAGIPVNVGSKGSPSTVFNATSTRFGLSYGRRQIATGQTVTVNLYNASGSTIVASGTLIVDEVDAGVQRRLQENQLLGALTSGIGGCFR